MTDAKRSATSGEFVAFGFLLALWVAGFAAEVVIFARQWQALDSGDFSALSSDWLTLLAALLSLVAWVLAIVLAVRLRRWGWLVACVLLFVAVPVFAVVMLAEGRTTTSDRQQQASFEQAMARALAEQEAERAQAGHGS